MWETSKDTVGFQHFLAFLIALGQVRAADAPLGLGFSIRVAIIHRAHGDGAQTS